MSNKLENPLTAESRRAFRREPQSRIDTILTLRSFASPLRNSALKTLL